MLTKETMDMKTHRDHHRSPWPLRKEFPVTRLMKQALEGYADSFDYDNQVRLFAIKGQRKRP